MPFSSGTFSRVHDWTTDRDAGIKISASRTDAEFDGIATGLTTCILKDGTQTLTAMIPFTLGLSVPTDKKIQLRDSAIFINSSTDGQLDIDSDTKMVLTSPIVDIDASTAVEISNDLKLNSDGAILGFGADSEIKLTHSADNGLILKHDASGDDKFPTLTLQTGDTDIAEDDVLGRILFQAPDEDAGVDAVTAAARIQAISEGDFSASSNVTSLELRTAQSGVVGTADQGSKLTLTSNFELQLKSMSTADGSSPIFELQTGETAVETNDVLGSISWKAPDESGGTDAITQAAFILARAGADFTDSVNDTKLQFGTGLSGAASTRLTLDSDGDLIIEDGDLVVASGHGIDFSATSDGTTSTSELFDDYETGNFSVSATIASGALTISSSYNKLSYTKIGQRVFVSGGIRLADASASGSPSGTVHLDDLPFTPASASEDEIHSVFFIGADGMTGLASGGQPMMGQIIGGNTNIFIFTQDQNGFADPGNHFTDNSILRFNFSYIAA